MAVNTKTGRDMEKWAHSNMEYWHDLAVPKTPTGKHDSSYTEMEETQTPDQARREIQGEPCPPDEVTTAGDFLAFTEWDFRAAYQTANVSEESFDWFAVSMKQWEQLAEKYGAPCGTLRIGGKIVFQRYDLDPDEIKVKIKGDSGFNLKRSQWRSDAERRGKEILGEPYYPKEVAAMTEDFLTFTEQNFADAFEGAKIPLENFNYFVVHPKQFERLIKLHPENGYKLFMASQRVYKGTDQRVDVIQMNLKNKDHHYWRNPHGLLGARPEVEMTKEERAFHPFTTENFRHALKGCPFKPHHMHVSLRQFNATKIGSSGGARICRSPRGNLSDDEIIVHDRESNKAHCYMRARATPQQPSKKYRQFDKKKRELAEKLITQPTSGPSVVSKKQVDQAGASNFSYTAAFEFPDGTVFEIPPPEDGTMIGSRENFDWPHVHVTDGSKIGRFFEIGEGMVCGVDHEDGRMMLCEYVVRICKEKARILWRQPWLLRPVVAVEIEVAKDPKYEGHWPLRRPSGAVTVREEE